MSAHFSSTRYYADWQNEKPFPRYSKWGRGQLRHRNSRQNSRWRVLRDRETSSPWFLAIRLRRRFWSMHNRLHRQSVWNRNLRRRTTPHPPAEGG